MKLYAAATVALLALCASMATEAFAGVVVTIEAPGVQSSQVSGVTTETFDTFTVGDTTTLTSVLGTYTPGGIVNAADQFGGAGGVGNYFAVGAQSAQTSSTLTLNAQPNAAAYFGNPNSGQDSGEPFVYVNFFGTDGTTFTSAEFANLNLSTGFESDNHSVSSFDSIPITGLDIVPEPSPIALFAVGGLFLGFLTLRSRRFARR